MVSMSAEHFSGGGGAGSRFISGHTPSSGRQPISSPLAKLSMSSSLEDGGGGGISGLLCCSPAKRRNSETSVDSRDEGLMESDGSSEGGVGGRGGVGGLEGSTMETCRTEEEGKEDKMVQT